MTPGYARPQTSLNYRRKRDEGNEREGKRDRDRGRSRERERERRKDETDVKRLFLVPVFPA